MGSILGKDQLGKQVGFTDKIDVTGNYYHLVANSLDLNIMEGLISKFEHANPEVYEDEVVKLKDLIQYFAPIDDDINEESDEMPPPPKFSKGKSKMSRKKKWNNEITINQDKDKDK